MARRRGVDLTTERPLRFVEEFDGFSVHAIDKAATQELSRNIMLFHLGMMALFMTVVLAPFAWIAALLNIVLSPKIASHAIDVTQHGVKLRTVYTRGEPSIGELQSNDGVGPLPVGLGDKPASLLLPFSEMEGVYWNDYSLRFRMRDGNVHETKLEVTSREDIERLGKRIDEVFQARRASLQTTDEEADAQRREVQRLAQAQSAQRQRQR